MEIDSISKPFLNNKLLSTQIISSFRGGLNSKDMPFDISVNQLVQADNIMFNPADGSVMTRYGVGKMYSGAKITYEANIGFVQNTIGTAQGLWVNPSTGAIISSRIATNGKQFFRCTGTAWTDITGSVTNSAGASRVRFSKYGNYLIAADGINNILKIDYQFNITDLGSSAPKGEYIIAWNDFLFVAGDPKKPQRLYYSTKGDPTTFSSEDYIDIGGAQDGDPIMGLGIAYGYLIIFRRRSIHAISGTVESDFTQSVISNGIGMSAKQTCTSVDMGCYFLSDNGLYEITSSLSVVCRSRNVDSHYRNINTNSYTNIPCILYNQRLKLLMIGVYYSGVAQSTEQDYNMVMCHDLKNIDENGAAAVTVFIFYYNPTDIPNTNLNPLLMSDEVEDNGEISVVIVPKTGYFYKFGSSYTSDDGNAISYAIRTKDFNLGDPMAMKSARFIRTIYNAGAAPSAFSWYFSNNSYSITTVTKSVLPTGETAERVSVPDGYAMPYRFIGFGYSGSGYFNVLSCALEYTNFGRRP